MGIVDHFIALSIAIVMIIGGYQFYFLPQKFPIFRARVFNHVIENKIPLVPQWVWVYSGLYYPTIVSCVFVFESFSEFNRAAFNFLQLLAFQVIIFFVFPVKAPDHWRTANSTNTASQRMLDVVWRYDSNWNCFPSAHVSFATLTAIYLQKNLGSSVGDISYLVYAFPIAISFSAIFTKQHYIIDIPFGFLLAILCYYIRL